jgi:hypothetical protein
VFSFRASSASPAGPAGKYPRHVADDEPEVHELLRPLEFLVGEWRGTGSGLWGDDFTFEDHVRFAHDGRPVLLYQQQTAGPDGKPSHGECGYFVVQPDGEIHVTIAEPSGITEVLVGDMGSDGLVLASTDIGRTPTTDNVTAVRRRLSFEDGGLVTEVAISVDGGPMAEHTRSSLKRLE